MRFWSYSSPGKIEKNMRLVADAIPPMKAGGRGQVLVEVISAALNPADFRIADLGPITRLVASLPNCPGMDFSGRVVSVSDDVIDLRAGDAVIGRLPPSGAPGALSEFVTLPRDACAALPEATKFDEAAGLVTSGLSAYQAIVSFAKAGDKVFINGGSGGVGTFSIQIAKHLGCHVTVTCSTGKISLCKRLGADEIIDYTKTDVRVKLREFGLVFSLVVDNVGNSPSDLYRICDQILLKGGKYQYVAGAVSPATVVSIATGSVLPAVLGGAKHTFQAFFVQQSRENMEALVKWMAEGKIETVIDSIFEFEDAPQAYKKLRKGRGAGKIIVHVKKSAS
jgi:NADPH:quinone reductase-like Zn-dependent oxidoreductase